MTPAIPIDIARAREAALEVLRHNARGPFQGLPRTAGWGYPEPYTRDLMIAALGILVSGDTALIQTLQLTLETVASNQSERGHIPSLIHDPDDRGASDTTPLFLLATALYRQHTGDTQFLHAAVAKALRWMEYQSPGDTVLVAQQPTSDWRDEQWVLGYGLYVNTIVYTYLRLYGQHERAADLQATMSHFAVTGDTKYRHVHEGLVLPDKPYYALWSYKVLRNERFDLLGNSLAILSGIASPEHAEALVLWIETECTGLRERGELDVDLPPCLFPYMRPTDPDWHPRCAIYNRPGEYHNGGIWPFVCGFYIAALVAAGRQELAESKLLSLTALIQHSQNRELAFGFNEWHRAQDGTVRGQDWQTWSAAMYLYAAQCVEDHQTPFFSDIR